MKNLKKLIASYETQAKAKWAIEEDMSDMYLEDAADAAGVLTHILAGKLSRASELLSTRDTIVREAICMAIAEDKGNDYLVENFGWSIV
jgi:hypothetical protein